MLWDFAKLQPRWWPPNFHALIIIGTVLVSAGTLWAKYAQPLLRQIDWNSTQVIRQGDKHEWTAEQQVLLRGQLGDVGAGLETLGSELIFFRRLLDEFQADIDVLQTQQRDNALGIDTMLDWAARIRRQLDRLEHRVTEVHGSHFGRPRIAPVDAEDVPP